jgi:hypothetical protein
MTETGVQFDTGEIIETKALICDSRSGLLSVARLDPVAVIKEFRPLACPDAFHVTDSRMPTRDHGKLGGRYHIGQVVMLRQLLKKWAGFLGRAHLVGRRADCRCHNMG